MLGADRRPEAVAGAVIEFRTTTLIEQPRRAGKPLRGDLGTWRRQLRLVAGDAG